MEKLTWRESMLLKLLSSGEAKRISGSGAGPATLDALVARQFIVHILDPQTRADSYRITARGAAALKAMAAQEVAERLLSDMDRSD